MVDYVLIENYTNMTLEQIFQYPTTGDQYFYVFFLMGLVFIMSSLLYFREVNRRGFGNYLSSLAISCFAGIVLTTVGSLFGLFAITNSILLFTFFMIPIALWWFGTK